MAEYPTHDDHMREKLKDFEYAQGYLEVSLDEAEKDGYYGGFLIALRRVVEVHGASRIAHESSVSRSNLYKALSEDGNPTIETLGAVLHSLGMKLSISPLDPVQ